jgi:hypothetical protein
MRRPMVAPEQANATRRSAEALYLPNPPLTVQIAAPSLSVSCDVGSQQASHGDEASPLARCATAALGGAELGDRLLQLGQWNGRACV